MPPGLSVLAILGGRGRKTAWKSRYLDELSDDAIDSLVRLNGASPSPHSTVDVWQLGGAMSRVAAEGSAFRRPLRAVPHRYRGELGERRRRRGLRRLGAREVFRALSRSPQAGST
jgi:hypothetical protein